jgi:hypothetical protein
MQELSQKLEGVETVDPPSLSRRIRREFPDLTSPQTKSASRQLLSEIRRKLDLRVPRRPRTFARLVRNRTTSKVSYHAPLYGYAFSRIKSTPHHHSHALRRHARAKSLGLLSPSNSKTRVTFGLWIDFQQTTSGGFHHLSSFEVKHLVSCLARNTTHNTRFLPNRVPSGWALDSEEMKFWWPKSLQKVIS